MNFDPIQIKNFKCFDDEGCIVENLREINIIIGKNNSGKSSLIEIIKFLTTKDKNFFSNKRNGRIPELIFSHYMQRDLIRSAFPQATSGGLIGMNHYLYGLTFENSILRYSMDKNGQKKFIGIDKEYIPEANKYFNSYTSRLTNQLENKTFSHLSAERDILPEQSHSELSLTTTGIGATNLVQQIINRDVYNSDLVEKTLLKELNKIVNPDIHFTRILVQQNEQNTWEIYFENNEDGRIPLSKMGSGVKTVFLVLILLYVKPVIDDKPIKEHVFALEELENNLHPSLQRRLYYYIYEFSNKNKCIFFLTTHSNIVIDLYNSIETSQIFHINKIEGKTKINAIINQSEFKQILDDLEVKASDILQSNGIIWVEGPSDRTYINKWLSLIDNSLIEGYHYSIMFYGGRLLSNLSFDYALITDDLIPLLKLNRNSFVVMDRDGITISAKLNNTKIRIQTELGDNSVWITKGREIENYLNNECITKWLDENYKIKGNFENEINTKFEDNISKLPKTEKIKYNLNKNKFASEIIEYFEFTDLDYLDLKSNLTRLVENIKNWNKI